MRRTAAVLLVSLVALAGCGDDDPDDVGAGGTDPPATEPATADPGATEPAPADDPLADRTFSVGGEGLAAGATVTLAFRDGAVVAETGCNRLSGRYVVDGGTLTVTDLMGTEMGCEPDLTAQEDVVRDLLQRPNEVTVDGDEVRLSGEGGTWTLIDDDASTAPALELVGPTWALATIADASGPDGAAGSVPAGVTASVTFAADGTYRVAAGCNSGSGGYAEAGAGIYQIDAPGITRRRCDDDAMGVEAAVLAVLDGEVSVSIEGDRLTIQALDDTSLGFTAT